MATDPAALARDVAALTQVPSVTGDERAALERLGEMAAALGLDAELVRHDLAALRAHLDVVGLGTEQWHPFALAALAAFPGSRSVGVPYGADMRHFTERGIPTVMVGPGGFELAHAADERVRIDDLVELAAGIERLAGSTIPPRG